jgi:Raf kinase inhibitor-like YbhB/YbcL family protein
MRLHKQEVADMNATVEPKRMILTSSAFVEGQTIRRAHTADGADVSPELQWSQAPDGTKSFAVTCRDSDAPSGTFIHWVIYNIPGTASGLSEGLPRQERLPDGSIQGKNDFQEAGYIGPKPPPRVTHNYHFEVYALDNLLPVETGVTAVRLLELMKGHILATAKLTGIYRR